MPVPKLGTSNFGLLSLEAYLERAKGINLVLYLKSEPPILHLKLVPHTVFSRALSLCGVFWTCTGIVACGQFHGSFLTEMLTAITCLVQTVGFVNPALLMNFRYFKRSLLVSCLTQVLAYSDLQDNFAVFAYACDYYTLHLSF